MQLVIFVDVKLLIILLIEYCNWFSWISETFLVVGNLETKITIFWDVNDGIVDNF
jgi:hypothetical protein